MYNYNSMEKQIALFLSRFPRTKLFLKKLFQRFNYIIYNKSYDYDIRNECIFNNININNHETFFGYYDNSPINKSNKYLIFHSTDHSTNNKPNKNKPITVVLYDLKNNKVLKEFPTNAYNWQQGAKLQWMDEYNFIFNDYDKKKDRYISKIVNSVLGEIVRIVDYPIYDVKNNIALSLNFDRLRILTPDYGYRNRGIAIDINNIENDGIYLIDLENNTSELIISLKDVVQIHNKFCPEGSMHWFNHIMISPNGEKFMFLHRWLLKNRRYDALFVADIDGNNLKFIANNDMVSHCFWKNNYEIVSFMRNQIYGDKYYLVDIETGEIGILGEGIIDKFGDGHLNIYKNNMLFDTYPNKARMKELYLFNLDNHSLIKLGEFFESFKFYGETRCDLHPRWSFDGKYISFDSVHDGMRNTYILENANSNGIE